MQYNAQLDDDVQNDDENSGDAANTYLSPPQHNAKENRRVLAMESERQSAMEGSGSKKRRRRHYRRRPSADAASLSNEGVSSNNTATESRPSSESTIAGTTAMSNRNETPNTDSESDTITFAADEMLVLMPTKTRAGLWSLKTHNRNQLPAPMLSLQV